MPAETPPLRPDADPPQCALPEARPDRDAGTKLRAAVLGANDGLVSNLCLVMGVAGGSMAHLPRPHRMAGLVSRACSMALGAWLGGATPPRGGARASPGEKTFLLYHS
ncbi:hypothetical protein CDO43_39820, partial [Pseudomonas aeruginosa]